MKHIFSKYPLLTACRVCFLFAFVLAAGCKKKGEEIVNDGKPVIFTVSPGTGRAGNKVNITGANFAKLPQDNKVFFNGIPAELSVGIDEELLVTVPSGATTGPVTVEVPGFGTIAGPVFTIERFLQTDLYVTDRERIQQIVFDENGQFTQRELFRVSPAFSSVSMYEFAVDTTEKKIYVTNGEGSMNLKILKVDMATGTGTALYEKTDTAFPPFFWHEGIAYHAGVRSITIDPERRLFYTASANRIIKGNMDGGTPAQVIYENSLSGIPTGVVFVRESNSLYWCERAAKKVYRLLLNGPGTPEVLYDERDGLLEPSSVVVDVPGNRVFIVDDPVNDLSGQVLDKILIGNLNGSGTLQTFMTSTYGDALNVYMGIYYDATHQLLYWGTQALAVGGGKRIVRANPSAPNTVPDILVDRFGDYQNTLGELQYFSVGATK